jgi:hypothetical protein
LTKLVLGAAGSRVALDILLLWGTSLLP